MKLLQSVLIAGIIVSLVSSQPLLVVHVFNPCAASPSANDLKVLPDPIWQTNSQLTSVGLRQCYLLGQEMYQRYYGAIVPAPFDPRAVYLRSLQLDAATQSAQAYAMGLFAGQGRYINNIPAASLQLNGLFGNVFNLSTQSPTVGPAVPNVFEPAPIHSTLLGSDWTLSPLAATCPKIAYYGSIWTNSSQKLTVDQQFSSFYDSIGAAVGLNAGSLNLLNLPRVWSVLQADYYAGATMKLQPGTQKYNILRALKNIGAVGPTLGHQYARQIAVTPFLNELQNIINQKIAGTTNVTFYGLAANDQLINTILAGFNISNTECYIAKLQQGTYYQGQTCPDSADVGSSIIFELNQLSNNTYTVKLTYNDVEYQVCDAIRFADGRLSCDYPYFQQWAKNLQVFDYYTACTYGYIPFASGGFLTTYQATVGFAALIWLICIFIFIGCFIRCILIKRVWDKAHPSGN